MPPDPALKRAVLAAVQRVPKVTFRWDARDQQYIYNWQTKGMTAGYQYRIGVELDDGQIAYATVSLK